MVHVGSDSQGPVQSASTQQKLNSNSHSLSNENLF